jgi:hypothetical protein
MRIDDYIVEQARAADVVAFFEKYHGFTFAHRGGEYRCEQHKSLAVKADRLSWYWHSKGIGGFGVLDYLAKIENMPFRQAVEMVTGIGIEQHRVNVTRQIAEPPKTLILPESVGLPLKLYDYLCVKRGIDGGIVNSLIQKEMLYEDRRGNVVFVGYDEQGKPRFASLRGTHGGFRGDCAGSDKRYGFCMASPDSDQLYIFESPIDAMSHGSIDNAFRGNKDAWERLHRLSLAGTTDTAIPFFLNQHKAVKELVFCLDNDAAGREASRSLSHKYHEKGYNVRIEPPYHKDLNEDLTALLTQQKSLKRTKSSHRDVEK